MPDRMVRLEEERARIDELWRRLERPHAPLTVAAAYAYHQVRCASKATVSLGGYQRDLNIAAAALSRLVPVYVAEEGGGQLAVLPIDLCRQRFAEGARALHCRDGRTITGLSVLRADALPAIALIRREGLPLGEEF